MQSCYTIYEYSNLNEQCLEGESNENLKSAIKNIYKYLRFSFDSPSYLTDAWNLIFPEPLILEGESNENLKSAIKNIYKYLRFSFDSPSYLTDAWNLIFPEPLIFSSTIYGLILGENAKHKIKLH